jgi:methyl-accepting chemotaxis protein
MEQSSAAKGLSMAIYTITEESEKSARASETIANSTTGLVSESADLNKTVSRFVV